MLSLDLFDSRYEKRLHEGALDDTITRTQAHLMEPLSRRAADIRTQIRSGKLSGAQLDKLEKEYEDLVQKRLDIMLDRQPKNEQQVPSKQDPFAYVKPEPKGIGDTQDPQDKMAQLQQKAKKGPLANVAAGIKAFVKGEPEPMGEEQQLGRRGIGMANMKALQSTVEKGFARTVFQFSSGKYVVGEDDTDKMADYYNALDSAGRTNFVYNVLGDGAKFIQMSRELGIQATPVEPQQPELPGMPQASPQRELPLSEKKKSNSDDLEAGDIKVARELQKLRAEYPAARSDIEAVARAEIDSTERSQRQLSAIRGANEKQDALLKQLVALDQEQGREISGLDKENNSLEKQLDQVQRTNAALAQTVSQMTGTKKSARPAPQTTAAQSTDNVINLIPGAPADQQKVEPQPKPLAPPVTQTATAKQDTAPAPKLSTARGPISQVAKFAPPERLIKPQKVSGSDIKEHGGGIGPRQHWQSMMPETALNLQDPQGDYEAKRQALHDLSLNKDVDQAAVLQRRLDLDREAKAKGITETVVDVKSGMAKIYRRLAPKIERHRDSFLAGQLYDELENYAELHGAEGEFKRMMATARNSAHMEYDTNPGGFQNWFWFLPFEDNDVAEAISKKDLVGRLQKDLPTVTDPKNKNARPVAWTGPGKDDYGYTGYQGHGMPTDRQERDRIRADKKKGMSEGTDDIKKRMSKLEALALAANRAGDDAKCKMYQQKIQSLKQKLSQSMEEGWSDQGNPTAYSVYIDGREWRAYKSDDHARAVAEKVRANLKRQGRDQTVTIAPSQRKQVEETHDSKLELAAKEFIKGIYDPTGPVYRAAYRSFQKGQDAEAQLRKHIAQKYGVSEKDLSDAETTHRASKLAGPRRKKDVEEDFGMPGTTIPRKSLIQGYTVYFNPKTQVVSVTRGGDSEEAAIEQQKLSVASMKNFRQAADRLIDKIESDLNEAKEILTKNDFLDARDYLLRKIDADSNPANKQIIRAEIRKLESQAETEGWITMQQRMVREDSDSGEAVEMAIMRRMLVAHTDLIVEFGLDKVVAAIEEVAYDVGDTDEIGTSDVSGWVNQVRQILGADA